MCIIIGKMRGIELPSDYTLDNCNESNRDGIGIAWTTGDGKISIKKDFEHNYQFKTWLKENIDKDRHACIIHYRLATHGKKDCGNAHPFPVTDDKKELRKVELECDMAVAHNGTLSGYGDQKYSDTQDFIANVLSDKTLKENLTKSEALRHLLCAALGSSRMFFLYPDANIWYYGNIEKEENGLFYSNKQYKYSKYMNTNSNTNNDSVDYSNKNFDRRKGKWVDKKESDNRQITVMETCFSCNSLMDNLRLYTVIRLADNKIMDQKMCGKCMWGEKNQNRFFVRMVDIANPKFKSDRYENIRKQLEAINCAKHPN